MATRDPSTRNPERPDPVRSAEIMSADEFRAAVHKLGFATSDVFARGGQARRAVANDEGLSACARFFRVAPRTAITWAAHGPPAPVAIALRLMLAGRLDAAAAGRIVSRKR